MYAERQKSISYDVKHARNQWLARWRRAWRDRFWVWALYTFCQQQKLEHSLPATTFQISSRGAGELWLLLIANNALLLMNPEVILHMLVMHIRRETILVEIKRSVKSYFPWDSLSSRASTLKLWRGGKAIFLRCQWLIAHCPLICVCALMNVYELNDFSFYAHMNYCPKAHRRRRRS